ncbi:MAG TPA: hypothetical protein VMZ22_07620 [Acidimicrobiales bacterium]|nr:hypothetical protein [Acidimicrobiales bacterium]
MSKFLDRVVCEFRHVSASCSTLDRSEFGGAENHRSPTPATQQLDHCRWADGITFKDQIALTVNRRGLDERKQEGHGIERLRRSAVSYAELRRRYLEHPNDGVGRDKRRSDLFMKPPREA